MKNELIEETAFDGNKCNSNSFITQQYCCNGVFRLTRLILQYAGVQTVSHLKCPYLEGNVCPLPHRARYVSCSIIDHHSAEESRYVI